MNNPQEPPPEITKETLQSIAEKIYRGELFAVHRRHFPLTNCRGEVMDLTEIEKNAYECGR